MVRYSDESRTDFVSRIRKERGLGGDHPVRYQRKPIEKSDVATILAEAVIRDEQAFGHLYQYGGSDVWQSGN